MTDSRELAEKVQVQCAGNHLHLREIAAMPGGRKKSALTESNLEPLLRRIISGALAALDARNAAQALATAAEGEGEVPEITKKRTSRSR